MRSGDPRHIDVAEQIEIAASLACRLLDPWRAVAVVVARVHRGAPEVRVEDDESSRLRDDAVVHRDLTAGNRLDVARVERQPRRRDLLVRVAADELRNEHAAEMP